MKKINLSIFRAESKTRATLYGTKWSNKYEVGIKEGTGNRGS